MTPEILSILAPIQRSLKDVAVPWFLSDGFFILFWLFTCLAFVAKRQAAKRLYLVFFFTSMLAVGLIIGRPMWPFHPWHVWARLLPNPAEYREVWLEDEAGRQFVYDLRATPPLSPALFNTIYAPKLGSPAHRESASILVRWLLAKANDHEPPSGSDGWLSFPEREYSHYQCEGLYENAQIRPAWPDEHGKFVRLVIQKKRADFGERPGGKTHFTIIEQVRFP